MNLNQLYVNQCQSKKCYQIKYISRKVREVLGEIPVLAFINDVNYTSSGTMELLFNKVK